MAELKNGKPTAFPDKSFNQLNVNRPADSLVSVQSVVVDQTNRLWILDTGSIEFGPVMAGGAKLVGVDLKSGEVFKKISFPAEVARSTTYLDDVRLDLRKGKSGVAYITDSSTTGPNAIIVVDLETGRSRRLLNDDPSTKAADNFMSIVEGRPLMNCPKNGKPSPLTFGIDGIALSSDCDYLYYCPLCSRRLYRIKTEKLLDETLSETDVAGAVEDLGDRGFASDGLESDVEDYIYLTDYEHNAIMRRNPDGDYETLVSDPTLLWPDTLSVAADGYLYVIANQLHRQKQFHGGDDWRQKPYVLLRLKIDAGPVLLTKQNQNPGQDY